MNALWFLEALRGILKPMFPGLEIPLPQRIDRSHPANGGNENSKNCVNFEFQEWQFRLTRSEEFSEFEAKFIYNTALIVSSFEKFDDRDFVRKATEGTISEVVARTLSQKASKKEIIAKILGTLQKWRSETYEGSRISAAFVVEDRESVITDLTFDKIVDEDFSKVISNGYDTILAFDQEGQFSRYRTTGNPDSKNWGCPFRYTPLARLTARSQSVCLSLNRHGEILVFKDGVLLMALRRGNWVFFDHNILKQKIAFQLKYFQEALREQIYATVLDVSFARCGGCIGYVSKGNSMAALSAIEDEDHISARSRKAKSKLLALLPDLNFGLFDRRLRQELAGIDGAMIIGATGILKTAGAIISYPKGSSGGGRTAAAAEISKYGVGFKISADGKISVFHKGKFEFQFG